MIGQTEPVIVTAVNLTMMDDRKGEWKRKKDVLRMNVHNFLTKCFAH